MFLAEIIYPCKPQFYYIKVGFRGSALYRHIFVMWTHKSKGMFSDVATNMHIPQSVLKFTSELLYNVTFFL